MEESQLDLKTISAELSAEREVLVAKLAELSTGATTHGGYDPNFADSSAVIAERGEAETPYANLSQLLEDVEAALAKIEDGTYGICESCGGQIESARLEAIPTARLCMSCAVQRRR